MAAFPSIIVTAICIFCNIHWAFSEDHEALVIITNSSSWTGISLPYEAEEIDGEIIYSKKTKEGNDIEYSYLCPPQTDEVKRDVDKLSKKHPELKFCLEKNIFEDNPTICPEEVKPMLIKQRNRQQSEIQCGKSEDHLMYNFGFSYLRLIKDNPSADRKITTLPIYDVCFNKKDLKTLWTKHRLETGMFQGRGLPSQQIQFSYELLSTERYEFDEGTFSNINEKYKNQKSHYKMIPQMLVPHEDIALKIWKKTTLHLVNTASLWEKLVPLMEIINDGIRKAAISVNVKDTLYIYTTTYPFLLSDDLDDLGLKTEVSEADDHFGWNIWCKFIHYESENKGVMIYLHNSPDIPPEKIDHMERYVNVGSVFIDLKCHLPFSCDFRRWSGNAEGLSDDILRSEYAYCCEAKKDKVEQLFNIKLKSNLGVFDINSINIEGNN